MRKIYVLWLLSMLFMVPICSCEEQWEKEHRRHEKEQLREKEKEEKEQNRLRKLHEKEVVKIQKSINEALAEDDFVTAHQILGDFLLLDYNWKELPSKQETSVRNVYLAEIRFLVSKNDELSWNRAYMLPMEVPVVYDAWGKDLSGSIKTELYRMLYDYAVEFDNRIIKEKTGKKLGIFE